MSIARNLSFSTATSLLSGAVGSLPYQNAASSTVFLPLGTVGFILTAGASGPQWSNAASLGITTATNIAGGTAGQLLFQSTGGITAFAGPGTAGQLLVSAGASATGPVYTSTASIYVGRAVLTDAVAGAGAGNILVQSANNTTSFLSTGTAGQLLMSAGGAPVFVNTSSIYVAAATQVNTAIQTANASYFPTFVDANNATAGAESFHTTSSFQINPSTGLISLAGRLAVNNADASTGTNTSNALYVAGGAWINKNLTVAGDTTFQGSVVFNGTNTFVYSSSTVYTDNLISLHAPGGSGPGNHTWTVDDGKDIGFMFHYYKTTDKDAFLGFDNATSYLEWYDNGTEGGGVFTGTSFGTFRTGAVKLVGGTQNTGNTSTGDLTVLGGVGITGNVYIQGSLNVIGGGSTNIVGIISTATSIAGGTNGQLVYQVSPGVTGFVGPGTAGQLLFSGGTGIPVYNSTASTYVGNAVVSTNLRSGTPFQIPYQSDVNTTAFANSGTTGQFWQATTNGAPTWTTTANIYVANAAIATNLRSGTPFQIPYQSSANTTAFANSGTTGQFWQAATNGAPTWTTTANMYVSASANAASLFGGAAGSLPYQSAANATTFLGIGSNGFVLTSNGSAPAWQALSGLASGSATTATNLAGGNAWQIPYQSAPGATLFANSGTTGQFWQATTNGAPTWTTTANMYVANAVVSTNLRGGTIGQLHVQTAADTSGFVGPGTAGQLLVSAGAASPVYTNTASIYVGRAVLADSATTALTANLATTATNLAAGVAGSLPYQSGAGLTTFLGIGTNGFILASNGSAPIWQAISGLSAGTANTATNLAGGNAWQIPYQSAPGSTAFANSGTTGQFWQATTNGAPTWTTTANMYVANAVIATNVRGGTIGQLAVQTAANATGFVGPGTAGQLLVSAGAASPVYTNTASIYVGRAVLADSATTALTANLATTATNLAAGVAGSLPYQSSAGITTFLGIGTNGFVLTSNGSAPIWQAISGLSAGSATTATNLAGGNAWQIPYQTAPGATAFANSGTTGQFWQATTNGAPTWTTTANMYVANAVVSTNLRGGTIGQLHVQTAASTSGFVGPGTAGQLLVSAGAASPVYTNTGSIYVQDAVVSTNLRGGTAMAVPYQSSAGTTAFVAAGTTGQVLQTNGTGSAPTWVTVSGLGAGSATTATQVNTVAQTGNASYFLTFVDANNASAAGELVYTTSSFTINPATRAVAAGGQFDSAGVTFLATGVGGDVVFFGGSGARTIYNSSGGAPSFRTESAVPLSFYAGTYGIGGLTIAAAGGTVTINTNSNATSTTTGALRVVGGVGVGGTLMVNERITIGTTSTLNRFEVAGSAGQLFSVTDTFTGTVFSANDVSGIPSIEVLDTGLVKLAQYNGTVAISTATAVAGSGLAVWTSTYILSLGVGTSGSGTIGEIRATNEVTAYYSDRRLKENVQIIDNAIVKVLSLTGITYTPNAIAESYGYDRTKKLVGVFADEIEAVLPEAVRPAPFDVDDSGNSKSGENYKTVQYEKIVPLLIEAIKEQQKSIENLQKEIAQLKSQI